MLLRAWLHLGLTLIGTNCAVQEEGLANQHDVWKKMLAGDRDRFESLSETEVRSGQVFVEGSFFVLCASVVVSCKTTGVNIRLEVTLSGT